MYGVTRGTMTLIGAGVAAFLVWLSTQFDGDSLSEYWTIVGLLAAAGFVIALSQLLGGWTKWGWPRISGSVLLLGFLPVLIVVGWLVLAYQPEPNWFQRHVEAWSDDLGVVRLIRDLSSALAVSVFGLGLFFGLTFDTTGPRTDPLLRRRRGVAPVPAEHPLAGATERDDATVVSRGDANQDRTVVVPRDSDAAPEAAERRSPGDSEPSAPGEHPLASGETTERRTENR